MPWSTFPSGESPPITPRSSNASCRRWASPGIDLVIETSGIGWPHGLFQRVKEASEKQPRWIISLDASSEEMYRTLRGEGFAEAQRTAQELLAIFPDRTWVQAVRMKENEEDLEVFFKTWKARTENVIIQKYDTWSGMLPDRAVADLSPLKRFPCWHLKRDMAILLDGTVPLCRGRMFARAPARQRFQEDLDVIWARRKSIHAAHVAGHIPVSARGAMSTTRTTSEAGRRTRIPSWVDSGAISQPLSLTADFARPEPR